ncbi:MAG: hypothetical protein M1132_05885 [Chloroflexi bacterium]|nr:hypothetical protein [Chloroflexota bacterium]MCL5951241.1 hypothetical protein [Chloroflexota bacterium]
MPDPIIRVETKASEPIRAGRAQVIVRSRAVRIQLPWPHGGLIWNRPVSVSIYEPDGSGYRLPVRDMTRLIELALMALAGLWLFLIANRKTD